MQMHPLLLVFLFLLLLLFVVKTFIKGSATGWSLIQRSPTDCGASLRVISEPLEWGGSNS
jgi:hypothetical protein